MLESHAGLTLIVQNRCNQIEIVIKVYSAQLNVFPTSRKNSEGKISDYLWICKKVALILLVTFGRKIRKSMKPYQKKKPTGKVENCHKFKPWEIIQTIILLLLSYRAPHWFTAVGSDTISLRNTCYKLSDWLLPRSYSFSCQIAQILLLFPPKCPYHLLCCHVIKAMV